MRHQLTRFIPVTAALVLVLSACGSEDPSADPIDTPDTTSTATSNGMRAPSPIEMTGGGTSGSRVAGDATEMSGEVAASDATTDMMIAPYVITDFDVGDLPALPDNTTGYVFDAGAMPTAADVAALAAALGVQGEPVEIDDGYGVHWRVGPDDGTAPSVTLWDDAMQSWNFDWGWAGRDGGMVECQVTAGTPPADPELVDPELVDPAVEPDPAAPVTAVTEPMPVEVCSEPELPIGLPTEAEAQQRAADMLAAMGVDTAQLEFDTYADDWSTGVNAGEMIDGVTARNWGFSFGENAELQHAWGSNGTPEPVGPYPLIDLDAAIARLESDRYGGWGGLPRAEPAILEDAAPGDTAVSSDVAVSEPMPVDVPEAPPIEPEEITVTLVDVQPDLWWVWDADGSAWLVPAYRFIGDDGGWYTVPAVTDDFLIQTELPVESVPPPPETPVETSIPGEPPATIAPVDPSQFAPAVGQPLEQMTEVADELGWVVRVVERNGEPLAVTEDYRRDRINVAVVGDGGTEYVVRATLDDGTVIGEADIPGVTAVPIAEVREGVAYYPACGNEVLDLDGTLWYPIDPSAATELYESAVKSVHREQYEVARASGFARVAPPGPGDDTGTFIRYEDGIARFVSDSGNLDVWLTTQELSYDWVC